ncbi:MAG: NAD-dependent epimerase/dehydratase family protein, partial [Cycloclasticus sp.]|nr:NAD-dependent epimerase/dehydratase family protein [Cycloclasticus sp.]
VHCSTAVVVGDVAENIIDEGSQCNPRTPYERTKLEMERLLLNKGDASFEVVVLRPTAVFGARGRNLVKLADSLTLGNPVINYFKSCVFNKRSLNLVCVDNVVAAMVFLGETDRKVDKEVFIISDDNSVCNNYLDVENLLIKKLLLKAYPIPRISLPFFLFGVLLKLVGKPQSNPLVKFSDQKLTSFGFIKPIDFEQGVNKFVDWYQSNENT